MSRRVALGDRGRVPFALAGVLLVVSSALFAAGIGPSPRPPEPAVDLTMERTTADARAALRQAAASAAVAAASNPVITPADTPAGRVIGDGDAFENALEVRIYLAARERLRSIERDHRGVTGRVSLPNPENTEELARALARVSVSGTGPNDARLRVTIHNVTQTAERGGRVVGRRNLTVTVVVDSPVMAVHKRVEEFQERLNAGLSEPGLTRKVTARLYAVAWARGYAQYGGAPVENVVSNRHVGLLTNGAVLGVQRSVFGRSDPDGRRAHRAAVGEAALSSAIGRAPGPVKPLGTLLQEQITATTRSEPNGIANLGSEANAPAPNETVTVSVGETAVAAFVPFTYRPKENGETVRTVESGEFLLHSGTYSAAGTSKNVLNETTRRVYSARVRTIAAVDDTGERMPARPGRPDAPGDWERGESATAARVVNVEPVTGTPDASVPDDSHVLFEYQRRVTVSYSHVAVWENAKNHTLERRTYNNLTGTKLVRVAVVGQHAPTRFVPNRSIENVHEPHPGAGTNLADIRERVNESVIENRGGPGELAGEAALGDLDTEAKPVYGERPVNFSEQLYPDLMELRREIREINVTVRRGEVGTYEVNPAALLAEKVADREAELVGTPEEYESVAEKAKYELRAMYVRWVIAELETRARRHRDQESGFAAAVSKAGDVSLGQLRDGTDARRVEGGRDDVGELEFHVDGAPPYLTMSKVNHSDLAAVEAGTEVYPLKAENVNVFTIPYGDAVDGGINWVTSALSGRRTRLRTGASALGAAGSAEKATGNERVAAARAALTGQVNSSLRTVKDRIVGTLRQQSVGESTAGREEIADRAFDRWDDPTSKALAVSNRTIVDAVVAEAAAHEGTDLSRMDRDILRIRLRNTVTATLDRTGGSISGPVVATATDQVKGVVGNYTRRELDEQASTRFNSSVGSMPAGLPVAPVPGYWAVTTNVWIVNVKGTYERFAVETPRRTPTPGDASLSYVRDGANVTLDVDGDGSEELLGKSDRVSFDVQTAIVVVVPAGGTGVGDVDGNLQERSAGWKRVVADGPDVNATLRRAAVRSDLTLNDYVQLANGTGTIALRGGRFDVVANGTGGNRTQAENRGRNCLTPVPQNGRRGRCERSVSTRE